MSYLDFPARPFLLAVVTVLLVGGFALVIWRGRK